MRLGFENAVVRIPIDAIIAVKEIPNTVRGSVKYAQIAASLAEVGVIEPPVVARDPADTDRYFLLDGHLRVDILRSRGEQYVLCLIATENEAFTYNKRVILCGSARHSRSARC